MVSKDAVKLYMEKMDEAVKEIKEDVRSIKTDLNDKYAKKEELKRLEEDVKSNNLWKGKLAWTIMGLLLSNVAIIIIDRMAGKQ